MAVARQQCGAHRQCRLVVRGLPDAEPELRNGMAVIEFYGSLVRNGLLHGSYGWGPDDSPHMAGGTRATSRSPEAVASHLTLTRTVLHVRQPVYRKRTT